MIHQLAVVQVATAECIERAVDQQAQFHFPRTERRVKNSTV
jgi:hypothetical protein